MAPLQLSNEVHTESLERGQEYRFEVDFNTQVDISLKQGQAEIFGTEITIGPVHSFSGTKSAIYTWQGCELEIRGTTSSAYVSEESPMMAYMNLHFALDRLRTPGGGPKVLIIGPEDSGKTSLTKILAAYALKSGRNAILVNLDPREGMSTLPGTLSAIPISNMLDVSDGFGSTPTTGATEVPPKIPLAYSYGLESPIINPKFYKHILARLALAVNSRLATNPKEKEAGLIIDTAGVIDQTNGFDLIQAAIAEFEVNVIVCIGSERLAQDMIRKYDQKQGGITVLKIPRSGGCVGRETKFLHTQERQQIKKYFYGDQRQQLNSYSISVNFDDVKLYQVEESMDVNTSLMPIGTEITSTKAFVTPINASSSLTNIVIAMMHADARDTLESISESNVLGYLLVTDVDDEKRRMTLLAPFQGRLPLKALVSTQYRFSDN